MAYLDMGIKQSNNPLHGITLEKIVIKLQEHYGWDELAHKVNINCFKMDPSVKSSLKFLRKTPWARDEVESLYIATFEKASPWGALKSRGST
jgi:uncharacterized protein (DUF2132 family)